jgi:hypothetical protein
MKITSIKLKNIVNLTSINNLSLLQKKKKVFTLSADISYVYINNLRLILFNINDNENAEKSY